MKDNTRTAVGYVCIAAVIISYILFLAWTLTPSEFTFKIEMDNNTREAMESIDYPIVDVDENKRYVNVCRIFNDSTADCGVGGAINPDVIEIYGDCEYRFAFRDLSVQENK